MALQSLGTFPASALNVGLASAPVGLNSEITLLASDVTRLTAGLTTQLQVTADFPPNVAAYLGAFALLTPATLAALLNPLNWITLGFTANADLLAELGMVNGELAVVVELAAGLRAGLNTGSLSGWSYAGTSVGYGRTLTEATRYGFSGVLPDQEINALIIGASSFSAWGSFSTGFETGDSAALDLGMRTTQERLRYLGTLTGGQWCTGLAMAFRPIDLHEAALNGTKLAIEAQLEICAGLNLPAIADLSIDADIEAAIGNLTVQADLTADIDNLNVRAQALLDLIGEIDASLSAGGLSLWLYSGPASGLGSSFAPEVASGMPGAGTGPNGSTYGVVIATADPAAWESFGGIFKIAA